MLDVGAGRGAVSVAARAAGASVVAIDISREMLSRCEAPAVQGDARTLPVRTASFDLAVGAFSIHLLPEPVAGIREAARAVHSSGRVVLAYGGRFSSAEWDFWFEVLARHSHRGTLEPTLPSPTPIPDAEAAFSAAGLCDVRQYEAEIELPIEDPHAFLRGELAHGARSLFDRFEPDVRREVEQELLDHLEEKHRDGGLVLRRTSLFVEGTVR